MKIFVIVESVCVYSDTAKVEVEIIDLDERESPEDHDRAEQRAQEVMATYVEAG